jgi:hypothetical protein
MKIIFILLLTFLNYAAAQNVGIGNSSPSEKLDVSGNINVTGTIKANGVDGSANQVLMKNGNNVLTWGDLCDYKHAITFTTAGSGTWTVPAGVTRIRVEAWGGGGGGSTNGSGAGGGYVTGIFDVSAGDVSYTVGAGGIGGSALPGTNGGLSSVSFGSFFVIANGGEWDNSAATFNLAAGGSFSGNTTSGFYGAVGEYGEQNKFAGYQVNATTWRESQTGGKGGDGGNSVNTGGKGSYILRDAVTSTLIYGTYGGSGKMPGGGGCGTGTWGGAIRNGGQGMVIIHY